MFYPKNRLILKKYLKYLYLFCIFGSLYYFFVGTNLIFFNEKNDLTVLKLETLEEGTLWNEEKEIVENEIKRFKIQFKNLSVNYFVQIKDNLQCEERTTLLIIIPSRPDYFDRRMAIRNTWLKNTTSTVSYRFIVGSTWNKNIRELNLKELHTFKDIIITNIRDSYSNLTLKTYAIFQWQQYYCPKIEYLLKSDDDTVCDISRLKYFIQKDFQNISKSFNEKIIFGKVWSKVLPKRNPKSKWYVSYKSWNEKYFPEYCNGPQYLLTSKAVKIILAEALKHQILLIEDVFYTGILAESAGIQRIDKSKNFGYRNKVISFCDKNAVPYLTCINELNLGNKMEEINETFTVASKKLVNFTCSKFWFLWNLFEFL